MHHLLAHGDTVPVHLHTRSKCSHVKVCFFPKLSYAATESLRVSYGSGALHSKFQVSELRSDGYSSIHSSWGKFWPYLNGY